MSFAWWGLLVVWLLIGRNAMMSGFLLPVELIDYVSVDFPFDLLSDWKK